jgi:DNA-binding response OmpR family regulator
VLVVDDDPGSAKLAAVLLRSEGCEVVIARSAEQAFAVLESFRPHAIVLDLILPLMSGVLFAQRVKENPETEGIVLVAVTVLNGAHTEALVRKVGCAAYMRKPINPESFAECVAACLRRKS